jgi:hypothetical protein
VREVAVRELEAREGRWKREHKGAGGLVLLFQVIGLLMEILSLSGEEKGEGKGVRLVRRRIRLVWEISLTISDDPVGGHASIFTRLSLRRDFTVRSAQWSPMLIDAVQKYARNCFLLSGYFGRIFW